ncbi:transposase [Bathymodiolus platifrons methanotrophic gill symbiont]|uniref:IS66 family transposase n=2 Tax=Bathymodiolus platifrons methanotrophic gill symbiont TaxID=113268 RepID=UPI000B4110D6|nr:IS66 family transposase [Bathymodiolus platifrons methanotrophic gill symbiont]GAW87399.1 transposase [Bathymodiolus platifrons methanotrophic gill symbiont]GFO73801.1 transposase, IS66 family [Bathymodiolus platifrons methanotrophic gill symbiont]GFO74218.1 transposase, IS66 family [Bathymodiolus platifrons methanotrophic gill symbiont]
MKIDNVDVDSAVTHARQLLAAERDISPALKSALEMILLLVTVLLNRVTLNSKNSSKPPASDPNRKKGSRKKSDKPSGGQKSHVGTTLQKIEDPDDIEVISIDRRTLPKGQYTEDGFETRQVFDIDISRVVIEYQAQRLINENGQCFIAPFPDNVTKAVQYGNGIKAHIVYLSQYQLLPYNRIQEYLTDQLGMPISEGSIYNFNKQAYEKLAKFEAICKEKLVVSPCIHADETGININGKRHWLHGTSNDKWTHFFPHAKRGTEAMNEINILPRYHGILCHDHWKPYYKYDCTHSLCNAHHLRELTRAWEQDKQSWALEMKRLLEKMNDAVNEAGGLLPHEEAEKWKIQYRKLLGKAEIECPPPDKPKEVKRGRIKRSKARNLLERLIDFEEDVLRFMTIAYVPFTNNAAENSIRMTKVQQKISGCFRSTEGAKIFCRVRGYLATCRKQGVSATLAMTLVFEGKLPKFSL